MKKLLSVYFLFFLFTFQCFAVDTDFGDLGLTDNQQKNLMVMSKPVPFKGFGVIAGKTIVGVSDSTPTAQQKADAIIAIQTLPTTKTKEVYASEFETKVFFTALKTTFSKPNLVNFAPQISMVMKYCDQKDFSGLRGYLDELVVEGVINQAKWNALNDLLKQQGIDLLNW